ncbi:sensor domain-containing protein [Paenibacillus kobensis]|uniref:sensor domain-containing protein n=1 Tax=Paenibacillus kobensis TaxID=59841 RepID=UPI000FDB0DC3|nr:sensor domain-containing protein [Paenibacillus kobensis]
MNNVRTNPPSQTALPTSGLIGRYFERTLYMLFITLPLSIVGFVLSVTLTALGFGLTPILIGLPILKAAAYVSHLLMLADVYRTRRLLPSKGQTSALPAVPFGPFTYRDMFTSSAPYVPLMYWVFKLPAAVIQFTAAVVFPLSGAAMLLTPAVYFVLDRFGIPILQDDVVFDTLFPNLEPMQRAYIGSGLGVLFIFIGWPIIAKLTVAQAARIEALLHYTTEKAESRYRNDPQPAVDHRASVYEPVPAYVPAYRPVDAAGDIDPLPFEPFDPNAPEPASLSLEKRDSDLDRSSVRMNPLDTKSFTQ